MGKIGLIIAREYTSRVKKKSFILMTLLGPILIVGFLTLAIVVSISDESEKKVLVFDQIGFVNGKLKSNDQIHYMYTDKNISDKAFEVSDFDYLLEINGQELTNHTVKMLYKSIPSTRTEVSISNQINELYEKYLIDKNGKINYEDYKSIKAGVSLKTLPLAKDSRMKNVTIVGFFFAIIIYMFIFLYGSQVMRGVIEEKSSRVVEVLVSSVKPFQLMMGKIIGIALVGLTQFLIWVILIIALMLTVQGVFFKDIYDVGVQSNLPQMAEGVKNVGEFANQSEFYNLIFNQINYPLMISLFVFYFIGGYLLYGALFAAIGAAVDSEADTQQFMLPITIPLVFSFIISQMGLENPDGNALTWAAVIPFTSPVSMMVKASLGFEGQLWVIFLSMFLLVAAFIFTTWLAAKIYRTGILMYGKKTTYKELWKWMRYKG
jgi:ABC-2 type transport system permease protein